MRSFVSPIRSWRCSADPSEAGRWILAWPIAAILIALCAPGLQAQSAANARQVYTEALKLEAEIRREMDAHQASEPVAPLIVRLRTLVGAYADMARLFPDNEQGDQALWQGAMLSADAFWRFGDEIDRASALNLLDALTMRYPDSAFIAQAAPHSRRLSDAPVLTPVPLLDAGPVVAVATPARPETAPDPEPTIAAAPPRAEPPQTAATAPVPRIPEPAAAPPSPSPRATAPPARVAESPAAAPRATPAPPRAAAVAAGPSRLTSIEGETLGDTIRFTLALDREVGVRHEQSGGPPRIIIDLHDTVPADTLTQALLPRDADVISRIRVGRHDGIWTRVVIELRAPSRYGIGVMREPYRVVIDVHPRLTGLSTDASVSGAGARR